ncbi:MAG: transcription-repair coupling factor [Gammaproteobacteria bacterium]|jgi:transcription-repair coupling factor (superfamily II helicase)|nr:transcription-repair coupling factor [Gammaproteobacteria bacterium]MBT5603332.1 transcription-repair coupling factor [Gammaproteobacteria bacterium]MBT6245469.1 transcription-repair coupling factor [Gammaproteobacteria bacterium]
MSEPKSLLNINTDLLPMQAGDTRRWHGLHGSALALAITEIQRAQRGVQLLIAHDSQSAAQLEQELLYYQDQKHPVLLFPDWETLIYDSFSPHEDIISARMSLLNQARELTQGIIIIPASTLMLKLAPTSHILGNTLQLQTGQTIDLTSMRRRLESNGYRCVESVQEHGEFAVRGSILDLFPMGNPTPFRIELFDDEVETIRTFDPESQRSTQRVNEIDLLPAREFPLSSSAIRLFQDQWHQQFSVDARQCPVYLDVSQALAPAGIEYYLPLFFEHLDSFFDYLPENLLVLTEHIESQLDSLWENAQQRYESLRYDISRPLLEPRALLLRSDEVMLKIKNYPRINFTDKPARNSRQFDILPTPDVIVDDRSNNPLKKLQAYLASNQTRLLIATASAGRREVVDTLFRKNGLAAKEVNSWSEFVRSDHSLALGIAPLDRSMYLPSQEIALISEQQLFGERVLQTRRRQKERDHAAELVVRSLTELSIDDAVVHIDHGIGRYQGLQTLEINDQTHEFLCLLYQDEAKLYVPVSDLHLVSRYASSEGESTPWHRLGGDVWQKAKRKAAEQIRDVAAELLDIYARREAKQGFSYPVPDDAYLQFSRAFPFEETADQETAIESVISDMTLERPMDRLICGDVGFGKTEVAMRAAFLAVQNNRQVALLVPTTLLAEQHLQSFRDRFAQWPVNIESISRFKSKKQQSEIIQTAFTGKVDILIGTHALIQDGLRFKNLGLLIIDEEHRFGVSQKEKLKSLRSEVDVLTLTATPIPRTLNLSMTGMRDLSIIATPPPRRLSIKTFIRQKSDALIKEAIQRELMRGGQVYYLHNEVKTIERMADELNQLVPEARLSIGHGQMRERELEQVMSDFYHKRSNVLVCTTIIETGIDVPNANTIIMSRADKFGLAQIHQLRGRVGRSHHQAYAYLLTPHPSAMTADSVKRLEAITQAEELGSGFILATHDLEIRGAGELLGDQQTGNLQGIGYGLFMEMLERAVTSIRQGKTPNLDQPLHDTTEVTLHLPALIPEDYLSDVHTRLVLYKRIANAENEDQLRELQVEMIDRFGLLPSPVKNLFRLTQIKLQAEHLGIKKVDVGEKSGKIEFLQETRVSAGEIVSLVQSNPHRFRLTSANQLSFKDNMEDREKRFQQIEKLLDRLSKQ